MTTFITLVIIVLKVKMLGQFASSLHVIQSVCVQLQLKASQRLNL